MRLTLEATDCIEGMKKLPDDSVDIVVTSPPYNIGTKYRSYKDSRKPTDYVTWTEDWCHQVWRVLKDKGSFFLNLGSCPRKPILPIKTVLAVHQIFELQNTFHWVKSVTVPHPAGGELSIGHFKPINSKRYAHDAHECVYHFTKAGNVEIDRLAIGVEYADKSNVKRWAHTGGANKRCRGNVWFLPYKTIQRRSKHRPHPATFPPDLAVNCILLHGVTPMTCVLDPFLGIGNSAIGAARCGVFSFIGFDIDPDYIADAKRFIAQGS